MKITAHILLKAVESALHEGSARFGLAQKEELRKLLVACKDVHPARDELDIQLVMPDGSVPL